MDNKRVLYIGVGIAVIGGAAIWYHKRTQTAQANADANAQADLQNAALLLAQPSYSGSPSYTSQQTGPTVDTGNDTLQALINQMLHPQQPTQPTQPNVPSNTVVPDRVQPHPVQDPSNIQPQPVMVGSYTPDSSTPETVQTPTSYLRIAPGILTYLPTSNTVN